MNRLKGARVSDLTGCVSYISGGCRGTPRRAAVAFVALGAMLTLLLSASVSHAGYVTLNGLNGTDTGNISVNGGPSQGVYIDQFNVTLQNDSNVKSTFATFCVDLTHDVSLSQKYQ